MNTSVTVPAVDDRVHSGRQAPVVVRHIVCAFDGCMICTVH